MYFRHNISHNTSCPKRLFQNEVKCEAMDKKMICKTHFQMKHFALNLVLKVRVPGSLKLFILKDFLVAYSSTLS